MRNLKRALSLTLASVMLLGMMVVGSSAASYPDVEDTHNVEAIEVLQAIKVMVGDDNGNFGPDDQVNRAQMAVVMALLLDLDYDYYKGTNPFWDVPSWAEPYVAACYANGIVSGYNATTYGAGDPVTAVQAASMMMRALGYFQYQSDYKDGFELSTVKQASKISLFKDINASGNNAALTRNQVAQLALNTLKTPMVEAKDNTMNITSTTGNGTIAVSGGQVDYVYVTSRDTKFCNAIDNITASSIGSQNDGFLVELGEKLFNGDLKLVKEDIDDLGRPSNTWNYKNDKIGTYNHKSELAASYNAKVERGTIYNLLSSTVRSDLENGRASFNVYIDGVRQGGLSAPDKDGNRYWISPAPTSYYNRADSGAIYTMNSDSSRRGTVTEVYLDKDNNVDIVIVNTYLFKATADYSSANDEVRIAPAGDTAITLDELTLKGEDFNITNIKADDYLLITAADPDADSSYDPQTVAVAEKVTGNVDSWIVNDSVTIAGQKYSYSAICRETSGSTNDKGTAYTVGQDAIVVLDAFDNIIAVDEAMASSSYVFVYDIANVGGLRGGKAQASAYFADGTEEAINVRELNGKKSVSDIVGKSNEQKWYTYSKNSDGEYTLYLVPSTKYTGSATKVAAPVTNTPDQVLMQTGKVNFLHNFVTSASLNGKSHSGLTVGDAKANDKTIVVVKDRNGDVTSYTGTSAIPDIKTGTDTRDSAAYYLENKNGYTDYVFVWLDGSDTSVTGGEEDTSFVYVLKYKNDTRLDESRQYYTYEIIDQDGKVTDRTFSHALSGVNTNDPSSFDVNSKDVYGLYYRTRDNKDGYVDSELLVDEDGTNSNTKYFNWSANDGTAAKSNDPGKNLDGYFGVNPEASELGDYFTMSCENNSLVFNYYDSPASYQGAKNYTLNGNSKITLIALQGSGINVDPSAGYKVYANLNAAGLNSYLKGYTFTGKIAGATTAADKETVDQIFITVKTRDANVNGMTGGISLSPASIAVGGTATIANTVSVPSGWGVSAVASDDTSVATVSGNTVTGVKVGTATIYVTVTNANGVSTRVGATITVTAAKTDPQIIDEVEAAVPTAMSAGVGDTVEDLSTEAAAKQAVKDAVLAELPAGVTVDTSARAFDAGWEFTGFSAPTNGIKGNPNGTDGKFATVKVQIKKGDAEGLIEMTNVTVKAKKWVAPTMDGTPTLSATTLTKANGSGADATITLKLPAATGYTPAIAFSSAADKGTDVANVSITGSGTDRNVSITPKAVGTGKYIVTVTQTSNSAEWTGTITVTVTARTTTGAPTVGTPSAITNDGGAAGATGTASASIPASPDPNAGKIVIDVTGLGGSATDGDKFTVGLTAASDGSSLSANTITVTSDGTNWTASVNSITITAEDGTTDDTIDVMVKE